MFDQLFLIQLEILEEGKEVVVEEEDCKKSDDCVILGGVGFEGASINIWGGWMLFGYSLI